MINYEQLEKLYTSYGFQVSKESSDVPVFLYEKGRYFGVDIIVLKDEPETIEISEKIKNKYSKAGYAVNLKKVRSNNEAEIELFKSFFAFESSLERLRKKYTEFQKRQTQSLFHKYEYVESSFEIQNLPEHTANIFSVIDKRFKSNNSELIIIEAAAGYGKTCTAFEVLRNVTEYPGSQIPMFTELSRNRSANIFKYILLDEINIEYPTLNLELVTKEIKNGRIPLIIDGFDELLIKTDMTLETGDVFGEVESMLDTIGNLLEHKTKIILTTRRTAIFSGIEFENWMLKWNDRFVTTRITIGEPQIQDWLGENKYQLVRDRAVPIEYLANPVLLNFLKSMSFQDFQPLMESPDQLINHYFEQMLEREKERQHLIMPVKTQLEVFRNVTRMLIEFDVAVEEKEFFRQIILDENKRQLEFVRSLYPATEKPSLEALVDTLSNHALLDRKGRDQTQVGFINDFVFGIFIGQVISQFATDKLENDVSNYMVELAVTAYRVQNSTEKARLWEKLIPLLHKFSQSAIFSFDVYLKGQLQRAFKEISIYDMVLFNVDFTTFEISSSAFITCHFRSCRFSSAKLNNTSFIECHFDACTVVENEYVDTHNGVTAIKCVQTGCSILIEESISTYNNKPELVSEFERAVLDRIWKISNTKAHHIATITESFGIENKRKVDSTLKTLQEKNYININGRYIHFEMNHIHIVKEILGIQ